MTLSNEINQLKSILEEYNINGIKDLRKQLQLARALVNAPLAKAPMAPPVPMPPMQPSVKSLQGKLTGLLGQLADNWHQEYFENDIMAARNWVEGECEIPQSFRFRSEDEADREHCERQIEFCKAVIEQCRGQVDAHAMELNRTQPPTD